MSDLMRIGANIEALKSFNSLMQINDKMSVHQLRLATGKRINSAGEDPAGYALARSLESRKRGLSVALDNVSNAKNVLNVAEGGYQNIMDILQTCKEKATQAADGSLSGEQMTAIHNQVKALVTEIDEIAEGTTFNSYALIGEIPDALKFHTGEQETDTLSVTLDSATSNAIGGTGGTDISAIDLTSADSAAAAISTLSTAIDALSGSIQEVGQYKARLDTKESNLSVAITNTEAVRSKIEDADFAKEQMEVMKLMILQQTALSSFVQSNSDPQIVLSLFR
ncbi:MAG TPA: flagellin [Candidatus Marinimicrobia bacterium]|nr:flagellin [Candidatus Neomarinimicrobiota bacterium]